MSMEIPSNDRDISRRGLFRTAIAGTGFVLVATSGLANSATTKVTQKLVSYQPTPKGAAKCMGCVQWQPPATCKVVLGKISPNGWCSIFAAKG